MKVKDQRIRYNAIRMRRALVESRLATRRQFCLQSVHMRARQVTPRKPQFSGRFLFQHVHKHQELAFAERTEVRIVECHRVDCRSAEGLHEAFPPLARASVVYPHAQVLNAAAAEETAERFESVACGSGLVQDGPLR